MCRYFLHKYLFSSFNFVIIWPLTSTRSLLFIQIPNTGGWGGGGRWRDGQTDTQTSQFVNSTDHEAGRKKTPTAALFTLMIFGGFYCISLSLIIASHQVSMSHFICILLTTTLLSPSIHFNTLHFTSHHCSALQCSVQNCTSLHITVVHCSAVYWTALHFTSLKCTSVYWTALHFTSLNCTSVYWTALHFTSY